MAIKKKQKDKPIITYELPQDLLLVREVIRNQYAHFDQEKFIRPHRRKHFSFFLITSGSIDHSIDFNHYHSARQQVFFLKPNQVYLVETAKHIGGITIICNPELLTAEEMALPVIRDLRGGNNIILTNTEFAWLQDHTKKMLSEFSNRDILSRQLVRSYFTSFLIYLSRVYQNQYPHFLPAHKENEIVQQFYGLIEARWKNLLQATDYALQMHISAGHLNYLLKKHTGKKTIDWIQEKRSLEIKRLLMYSNKSIKEIAYETGFEDPAYFNRFFKKWNGFTPLAFRQHTREKYRTML